MTPDANKTFALLEYSRSGLIAHAAHLAGPEVAERVAAMSDRELASLASEAGAVLAENNDDLNALRHAFDAVGSS